MSELKDIEDVLGFKSWCHRTHGAKVLQDLNTGGQC